ncbi:uncharacterized protein MELLADRAFT_107323 [Melampsora larici-populina 98AG31]|uniref:FHA domain-containing protein n=1 Tax=Melampsora larici-populina (strain 98AG31 / pathotype 3-4-7) TaxID=747676 RepID=F4RNY5_MELLP|nr:uncharacterized protein MELLADRAFT_107323 [Melampsora larici-populina 98AG31]EGG05830.1 hypothetical protein MELLADRAFT_107323 [Melampsora larici-populina 98AG31]
MSSSSFEYALPMQNDHSGNLNLQTQAVTDVSTTGEFSFWGTLHSLDQHIPECKFDQFSRVIHNGRTSQPPSPVMYCRQFSNIIIDLPIARLTEMISRTHCIVQRKSDKEPYFNLQNVSEWKDYQAKHGIFLNGKKLEYNKWTELQNGDKITLLLGNSLEKSLDILKCLIVIDNEYWEAG